LEQVGLRSYTILPQSVAPATIIPICSDPPQVTLENFTKPGNIAIMAKGLKEDQAKERIGTNWDELMAFACDWIVTKIGMY